jgi:hypothetical protein
MNPLSVYCDIHVIGKDSGNFNVLLIGFATRKGFLLYILTLCFSLRCVAGPSADKYMQIYYFRWFSLKIDNDHFYPQPVCGSSHECWFAPNSIYREGYYRLKDYSMSLPWEKMYWTKTVFSAQQMKCMPKAGYNPCFPQRTLEEVMSLRADEHRLSQVSYTLSSANNRGENANLWAYPIGP